MDEKVIEKLKKAGKICSEAKKFAREIAKKGELMEELAEKIEAKILELGGKPAFPVNLSINEIAAHSTPKKEDEQKAEGLLKIDVGVHIDGYIADSAFSIDLDNNEKNKELINAAEIGLKKGIEKAGENVLMRDIGKEIDSIIQNRGLLPIRNLTGHSIERYNLHAGISVPNFNNSSLTKMKEGVYALEPFVTNGFGEVRDGKPSGIYSLEKEGTVRDNFARNILKFIIEEYNNLPFCSRWICKKFGTRGNLALRLIEKAGLLHHYNQLIEKNNGKVAQAEHTIIISKSEKIITTY